MSVMQEKSGASTVAVTNVSVTSLANNENASRKRTGENRMPPITTSQSPEYCHRLAEITSRATLDDPLNLLFQREKTGRSTRVLSEHLYAGARARVDTMVAGGSFVVESGNFAAVACWQPPKANGPIYTETQLQALEAEGRPVFARFLRDYQALLAEAFGTPSPPPHWKLFLMARDPERKDKGAVRAVIEPFVARAKVERVPISLQAGSPRARDVYEYFGFRVCGVVHSSMAGEEKDVPTWTMLYNWPVE